MTTDEEQIRGQQNSPVLRREAPLRRNMQILLAEGVPFNSRLCTVILEKPGYRTDGGVDYFSVP